MVSAINSGGTATGGGRGRRALKTPSTTPAPAQPAAPANQAIVPVAVGRRGRPPKRIPTSASIKLDENVAVDTSTTTTSSSPSNPNDPNDNLDANGVPLPAPTATATAIGVDQDALATSQAPQPRKRGRPKKTHYAYAIPDAEPFKPLDSNAATSATLQHPGGPTHPTPKRRCEDCNVSLKINIPLSQTLCNDCNFDPSIINDEDEEDLIIPTKSSSTNSSSHHHRKRASNVNTGPVKKRTRTVSAEYVNDYPVENKENIAPESTTTAYPYPILTRVTSPTPTITSDDSSTLPKRFPCPTTEQLHYYNPHGYFYPSPAALEEPTDRLDFLTSRIQEMDQFQLAQVLCALDRETRREFDRALMVRRDASLDVARIEEGTWANICSIFANHLD